MQGYCGSHFEKQCCRGLGFTQGQKSFLEEKLVRDGGAA